ncbi:hypothetical protein FVEG_17597 [Fusarium verticillioides 7600]|uniref:Uncharacterized protein n=1 Tax=Gibberella moniliformis (strain M3125 / FGSC 7600) TaxID=334819 RepID=W7N6S6_GIBM7|nr:hypothetical protein FVEG_17597 [Fusarium verticillioides 7600]EWG55805.1 hypothetical protein FVEG_17597 [Fusarium verticillioides 7600]
MTETSQGSQPIQTDQGGIQEDSITTKAFGPNTVAHSLNRGRYSMEMEVDCENDLPFLHQKLHAIAKAQEIQYLAVFDYWVNEKKSEIDAQDSSGRAALHIAIELHLTLEAKSLVRGGPDVTIRDFDGRQPIYLACIGRQTEMAHFPLTRIKDVNALCNKKETLLASACQMGQLDIVNFLLENGADANISDDGLTPLHWACSDDEEEIVERLLQEDTLNINAIDKKETLTPLNSAVLYGHAKNVSLLLQKNADLYIKDYMDWTPLMTATRAKNLEIVRIILGHKVGWRDSYLEIADDRSLTLLHVASRQGSCEIASELIRAVAECDARSRAGNDADYEDFPGYTPLHHACSEDQHEIVSLLLPEIPLPGVEVDAKAQDQRTPLHVASLGGNGPIVELLLQRKADVNAMDDKGYTMYPIASR